MKKNPKAFITNETLLEAVDAILTGIEGMGFAKKADVDTSIKRLGNKIDNVEERLTSVETKVDKIDRKLDNLACN